MNTFRLSIRAFGARLLRASAAAWLALGLSLVIGAAAGPALAQTEEPRPAPPPIIQVAADGSGQYKTIQEAVVKALIQAAEAAQGRQQEEALKALTHGLAPESRPVAAAFFLRYLGARERHEDLRAAALAGLARHAGPADIPGLEAIAANERASSALRDAVTRLVALVRAKEKKKDAAGTEGEEKAKE